MARVPMEGFPWQLSTDSMPLDFSQAVGGSEHWGLGLTLVLGAGGAAYLLTKEPRCRAITRSGLHWLIRLLEEKSEDVSVAEVRIGDVPTPMMPSQRKLLQRSLLDLVLMDPNLSSTPAMVSSLSRSSHPTALSESMHEMVHKARRVRQLIWEASLHSTDADYTLSRLDTSIMIPNSKEENVRNQESISDGLIPVKDNTLEEQQQLNNSIVRGRDNFWHLTNFPGSLLNTGDSSLQADSDGSLEVEVEERTDPWEWDAAWEYCPSSPTSCFSHESGFSGSDALTPSPPPSPTPAQLVPKSAMDEDKPSPFFPLKKSLLPLWLSTQLTLIL